MSARAAHSALRPTLGWPRTFYGFDAVSTAAEETRNPARDLKIGIVGSMLVCTLLYMAVAAAALGGSSHEALADSPEPLAWRFET